MARQSMYFKHEREDRLVPSQHHTSEKTSDLVQTSDPHESGEATKAGHELEAAGQKRMQQTTDNFEANHLKRPQHSATWTCHPRRQKLQHWTGPNGGSKCSPYAPLSNRRYK